jgi:hypothetical protein
MNINSAVTSWSYVLRFKNFSKGMDSNSPLPFLKPEVNGSVIHAATVLRRLDLSG